MCIGILHGSEFGSHAAHDFRAHAARRYIGHHADWGGAAPIDAATQAGLRAGRKQVDCIPSWGDEGVLVLAALHGRSIFEVVNFGNKKIVALPHLVGYGRRNYSQELRCAS